jgi:hypothetical protein
MSSKRVFHSYDEFFDFYLQQHLHPGNRVLHAIGTILGIGIVIAAFATGHGWFALLFLPTVYAFAWTGHFLLEKNKPATFDYPFWSFISDFRMLALMLTGRLQSHLRAAEAHSQQ